MGKGGKSNVSKTYNWLINCPAHDVNFKWHLKHATDDEIKRAIEHLKTLPATKTSIAAFERELRRRGREKEGRKT